MRVLPFTCVLASVLGEGVSRAAGKTTQITQVRLLPYTDGDKETMKGNS